MASQSTYEQPAETFISLHDIFWYILKNWIVLLICMDVFGAGLGLYKRSAQVQTVRASAEAVSAYNALSAEGKSQVKAADVPKLVAESTILKVFLRFLLLGMAAGLFAAAAVLAVWYVIRGYLPNAPAIRRRYHLPTFGIITDPARGKADRFFMNRLTYSPQLSEEEALALTAANLAMHVRARDRILLIGTAQERLLRSISKQLSSLLDVQIQVVGDVNKKAGAVVALGEGCKVVCVEQILKSRQTYVDFAMSTVAVSRSECIGFILAE